MHQRLNYTATPLCLYQWKPKRYQDNCVECYNVMKVIKKVPKLESREDAKQFIKDVIIKKVYPEFNYEQLWLK